MHYNTITIPDYISHLTNNINRIKLLINGNHGALKHPDIRKAYLETLNNLQEIKLFLAFQPLTVPSASPSAVVGVSHV